MSTLAIAPKSLEDLGIRRSVLQDLALKILYVQGELSLSELAQQMHVAPVIAEQLFQRLRKDQLCEVTGMIGPIHRIQTTSGGKNRALELLSLSQYTGPAPVSLADYVGRVRAQSVRGMVIRPNDVAAAFKHMVLDENTLNRLGTAITSGRAIFLYGPTGTGKTTMAEALAVVAHNDEVWMPYAIEIDGQIVTMYDPHTHQRSNRASGDDETDPRWILCRRPRVLVGGELTIEMLDLQYNASARFYAAPVQLKANNGVLIIDDFGRQRVNPDQLLNRWVVPLDRQIDFLTLAGGKKIEVPFDVVVVFATNLDPAKLVDEAFLRRIQTKIKVDVITPEYFTQIFQRVCAEFGLEYTKEAVDCVMYMIQTHFNEPLRPCHPRDVVQQIIWSARYLGTEAKLDTDSIVQACRNYFVSKAD